MISQSALGHQEQCVSVTSAYCDSSSSPSSVPELGSWHGWSELTILPFSPAPQWQNVSLGEKNNCKWVVGVRVKISKGRRFHRSFLRNVGSRQAKGEEWREPRPRHREWARPWQRVMGWAGNSIQCLGVAAWRKGWGLVLTGEGHSRVCEQIIRAQLGRAGGLRPG
jgi:hypothetical protein